MTQMTTIIIIKAVIDYAVFFCLNRLMELVQFLNIEVEIIRTPKRRGITLRMHPDKFLCVKANKKISQKQIVDFLISKQR